MALVLLNRLCAQTSRSPYLTILKIARQKTRQCVFCFCSEGNYHECRLLQGRHSVVSCSFNDRQQLIWAANCHSESKIISGNTYGTINNSWIYFHIPFTMNQAFSPLPACNSPHSYMFCYISPAKASPSMIMKQTIALTVGTYKKSRRRLSQNYRYVSR